jgi:hypothetical protein
MHPTTESKEDTVFRSAAMLMSYRKLVSCLGILFAINICLSPLLLDFPPLGTRQLSVEYETSFETSQSSPPSTKILYIVTSIAEYDNGKRKTIEGRDRFVETLIPVVSESVKSMQAFGYQVDTYLIAHYSLSPSRLNLLRESLPASVGLQVWDDACPLGYPRPSEGSTDYIVNITRALARQHRYVIKDKFAYYDGE